MIYALIPAYKPTSQLLSLVQTLYTENFLRIVIVDDGSGETYAPHFDKLRQQGCKVLTHKQNCGKGRALKTGFEYLSTLQDCSGTVTADADGKYSAEDIRRFASTLAEDSRNLILGVRDISALPKKSRISNYLTCFLIQVLFGQKIADTRTGLRAIPADCFGWISELPGERFEFEINMLLYAPKYQISLKERPIETVCYNGNTDTNFRFFRDGLRIYWQILKQFFLYFGSSLLSFIADYALVTLFYYGIGLPKYAAIPGARVLSAFLNYSLNRIYVFREEQTVRSVLRYALLAAVMLGLNYLIIECLAVLGFALIPAKIIADVLLYTLSFLVQRRFVFG